MTDFEGIILECVDDIWRYMNCDSASSLNKYQVKNVLCTMSAHNEHISDDFDHAYEKFGK